MLLLGSRGATSDALADLLRTDEFRNFNPHLLLKNIKDEIMKNNLNDNIAFATQMFVEKVSFFSRTFVYNRLIFIFKQWIEISCMLPK